MHSIDTFIPHPRLDIRWPRRTPDEAVVRRRTTFRWRGAHVTGGVAMLALALLVGPVALQLTGMRALTRADGLALVSVLLLVQLPVLAVAAVELGRRRIHHEAVLREIHELESRVSTAETTVLRDEEKLHELKATIGAIAITHRLLHDRRTDLPTGTRTRLERLHESELARLQRLLSDHQAQTAGPIELDNVVGAYVESLRSRGHRVAWGATRALVWGRRDDVAEIVNTLLDNAVRHAPGAAISLSVSPGPAWVELTVADSGPGVAPEVAPYVFERGARSSASSGQGIGLDRAARLARDLGGTLRLREDTAQGAAFVLALPVVPATSGGGDRCLARSG